MLFFSSEMDSLSGHTGDGTIRIWDVTDGRQQQIGHLKGHEGPVWKVGRLRGRSSCLMRVLFVCLIRWSLLNGIQFLAGGTQVDANVSLLRDFP